MQDRQDIEKLLKEGNSICIKPQGYSMCPLFFPGRDEAIIEPLESRSLHRGDVVLYRRDPNVENGGILVLHRIWKVKKDGIYLVGDNQSMIEGPLRTEQMKGIMAGMNRKGKYIPVTNPGYRIFVHVWLWLRPIRPLALKYMIAVKSFLVKKK